MRNDVSSFEANHLIIAHEGGMAVIAPACLQDALKLSMVIRVPASCGAMLLMKVIKRLNFWQQAAI